MPMALNAAMGTEVFAAVPPTRVAAAAATPAPVTTATSAPPASAGIAPAPARRPGRSLALAAALGAVLVVGGGLYAITRGDGAAGTQPTAQNVTTGTAQPSDTVTSSLPAAPVTGADSSRLLASAGTTTRKAATVPVTEPRREEPAPVVPRFDAAAALEQVGEMVKKTDAPTLRRAVIEIDDLLPKLHTSQDSLVALYHKATAYGGLDETPDRACELLARVKSRPFRYTEAAASAYSALCP
jgi:hypothetical protein